MKRLFEPLKARRMSRHNGRWRLHLGHGGLGSFVVVLVLTLAAAVSTQANLLFWILGLLLAGALLSLGVATFSIRGLVVERLAPPHAVAGEPMTIRYRMSRVGRRAPLLNAVLTERCMPPEGQASASTEPRALLAADPIGWVAHVGNDAVIGSAVGRPLRRGMLRLDTIEIGTTFPFGILRSTLTVHQPQQVVVYPRLYPLREGLLERAASQGAGEGPRGREFGGQDEFYGLREYRTGDSVRTIDWKHSARMDRLISREMTRAAPPRLMILLDMDRRRLEGLASQKAEAWIESAIDLAASLVVEASVRGFAVGLAIAGLPQAHHEPHASRPHRDILLRTLALLDIQRTQVVGDDSHARTRPRPSVCIVPGPGRSLPRCNGLMLASADLDRLVRGPTAPGLPEDHALNVRVRRGYAEPTAAHAAEPIATGGAR